MSGRLSDEQVAHEVAMWDELEPWHLLASEVQAWRALVNGGPCETCGGTGMVVLETGPTEGARPCLCGGGPGPHGEYPCGQCGGHGVIYEQLDPREPNPCPNPDCNDGRRTGLIERLEMIRTSTTMSRYEVAAVIADLRKAGDA